MAPVLAPAALVRMTGGRPPPHFLEPLIRGQLLPAMAFTEPDAGSDLQAIRTTATKTDRGIVIDGTKTFISNGPTADAFLVAAVRADHASLPRRERSRGMGLYVVIQGTPGLTVGRPFSKLGMRSSETGELAFDSVLAAGALGASMAKGSESRDEDQPREKREERDGETGAKRAQGFGGMMHLLDFNRLYIAAISIGIAQAAFEASLRHVRERVAFDKPIGHHQATGFKIARMSTQLDASRALVQRACEMFDAGEPCTRQVSEAKLFATEAAVEIAADAVQIHGGYGYVEDSPVERYFRDAKVGPIWEGTSEIQQHVICRELGVYG